MSRYPSTLGATHNPLIERYQLAFLEKLKYLWKIHIGSNIPSDDFLLYPDIHGLILDIANHGTQNYEEHKQLLLREYSLQNTDSSILVPDRSRFILGTNITLTLDFHNPDIEKHTHPDHKKHQIGITFGSKTEKEWQDLFAESFGILKMVSPEFMTEIDHVIRKIIPFDVSYGVHNSGSYSNAIGHLLMSYPTGMSNPDLALLEAILHEYNHNKLNLILQTASLTLNDRREIYYSPYRPDARHIHGIYLGLHAIVGAYWVIWNAYTSGIITLTDIWQEKAVLYVLKNGLSLQVLSKYAQLSPLGREILNEMNAVHGECLRFIQSANIDPDIIYRAKKSLILHFQDVQKHYPGLMF